MTERTPGDSGQGGFLVRTLTLFCGLPGSGKTTLAKRLESAGRGVRVCADEVQAELGVEQTDVAFHGRLQRVLYRQALDFLRHGADVILEDGLWLREERTQKFADARASGARIELHVFEVPLDILWSRLQRRNQGAALGAYAMTFDELQWAWSVFEPPGPDELAAVDHFTTHYPGLDVCENP